MRKTIAILSLLTVTAMGAWAVQTQVPEGCVLVAGTAHPNQEVLSCVGNVCDSKGVGFGNEYLQDCTVQCLTGTCGFSQWTTGCTIAAAVGSCCTAGAPRCAPNNCGTTSCDGLTTV